MINNIFRFLQDFSNGQGNHIFRISYRALIEDLMSAISHLNVKIKKKHPTYKRKTIKNKQNELNVVSKRKLY